MSIQPPQGILNIPNATLRVGKLEVNSTEGLDTVLNNIERNTILLEDTTEYPTTGDPVETEKRWGLKVPNIFVATFEIKGVGSSFNFRNNSNGDATIGYTLTFSGTTLTLKYNNASLTTATIPNLDAAYGKVYLTYEKQYFTVTVDGTRVLTYKDDVTRTPPEGEYANFFTGTGGGFKNLKIVSGHLISDGTSNIAYVGGGKLDISGDLGVTSNTSILVGSDVVAEYTGPHDRPLRKYPEVALTQNDESATSGYVASTNNKTPGTGGVPYRDAFMAYDGIFTAMNAMWHTLVNSYDSNGDDVNGDTFTAGGISYVGHWNKLQLPNPVKVDKIEIIALQSTANPTNDQRPDQGAFLGSIDGTNWELIYSFSSGTLGWSQAGDLSAIRKITTITDITNTNKYNYLVLVVEKIPSTSAETQVGVAELRYYGYEEGSGSIDTTLKSVYNVPATTGTQLEVYYDAKDLTTMPTIVTDLSPNSNDGTLSGDPQVSNGAFVFDGTGDYISGTLPSSVTGEWVHSMSMWFKASNYTNQLLFIGNTTEYNERISIALNSTGEITIGISGSNVIYASAIPLDFGWHHLTYTYAGGVAGTGATGYKLYVDGVNITQTGGVGSGTLNLATGPNFFLGSSRNGFAPFNGSIANFRLYSKALNAGQVQELYDYQKDYFFGTHSSVTLHKGRFGVGTKEPIKELDVVGDVGISANLHMTTASSVLVDSNVVTEYMGPHDRPLRKYPEVALTANSDKGYVASISSGSTTYDAWKCFNGTIGADDWDNWLSDGKYDTSDGDAIESGANEAATTTVSGTAVRGEWVQLKLPKKIRLKDVALAPMMFAGTQYATGRTPTKGVVAGSIDGTNWELVKSFTASGLQSFPQNYYATSIGSFNSDKYYDYFRLIIEEVTGGTNGDRVALGEIEYYGYEEGSGSLDTTLKSVYNVPATTGTQLEVYYDAKDLTTMPGTVTDLSPNSNGGSVSGDPQVSNGAFVFDGVNDYIYNSQTGYTASDTYTASVWVKFLPDGGSSSDPCIFQFGNGSVDSSFGMISDSSENRIRAYIYANNNLDLDERVNNIWYHLCATYYASNGRIDFFINGILKKSTTSGTAMTIPSTPYLTLGAQTDNTNTPYTGTYFTGSIANFRLYSKALNADQVKELYDYQKDYFLGSKSQVTLYKGHLGVGVTEPSGQLELAGDERIQEYPPGPMDDYETLIPGHGVFCASSSAIYSGSYPAYKAFDKIIPNTTSDNQWVSQSDSYDNASPSSFPVTTGTAAVLFENRYGSWIQVKMPYKIFLKKMVSYIRVDRDYEHATSGVVYGSNDGHSHDIIYTFNDVPVSDVLNLGVHHEINANIAYSTYTFQITKLEGQRTFTVLGELKFFGTPGPTTLDKGSLSLTRSLDVPRVSRYDVDTETPRPEKLLVDFDTTVNSSPTDISGKGNHGTFNGTNMNYSSADKAFAFNGTDDVIHNNLPSELVGDPTLTISMWVNPITLATASGQYDTFIHIGQNSQDDQIQLTYYGFDGSHLQIGGYGQGMKTNDASAVPIGQWTHICAVITPGAWSATTKKLYINGEFFPTTLSGSGTSSIPAASSTSRLVFGGVVNGSGGYSHHANIKISNPKIYDVALEPSEVKKLYNLGRTGRSMVISDTAVGIGKVPEAQLDVRGTLRSDGLTVGGDIYATGNITGYSDRRAKSDIEKIENALEKIEQLNGYTFTMKGKRYTGLIAQEILPILPEAVTGSEETNYAVAYGNMMGLIVEAIKELKQKIG